MAKQNDERNQRGRQVVEEAARLMRQLRFSETHGAYAEGAHVALSIDTRLNDDQDSMRVLISCLPFGQRLVTWGKLPVQVLPTAKSSTLHAVARLNDRGQALISRLPIGEYRLSLRLSHNRVASVLSFQQERLAAQGEDDEPDEEERRQVWRGEDESGSVLWTLEETEEGEVQLSFETSDARFANHVILFSLVDPVSAAVRVSGRLTLAPARTPGKWEGWQSLGHRSEFPGPCDLEFEIEAPEEEP